MKKLLFFDTETNGLPLNFDAPARDLNNWPRVIQLAWELCWEDGTPIQQMCELIKPDRWSIPKLKFWIDNGFNTETNEDFGMPMKEMLGYFLEDLNQADVLIAHNMGFDQPVISAELIRYGLKPEKKTEKFCTKLAMTPVCKLQGFYGNFKWPTLKEAYEFYFGAMPAGAHQADFDVDGCKKVYLQYQKNSILVK